MSKFRKGFVVSVMFITVLAMSVVVAPEAKAAASAGSLIKMNGLSSVYYLGADSKRYVFPNETTYFSWYKDFSSVVTIPQSELESYSLGANVTMRPGTNLVKITTNPKVYAVEAGGNLVWVPSEAVASTLYGSTWASKIVDVPDAFFTNYKTTSKEVTASAYPQGSLVKFGGTDVYYINADGTASKVSAAAFDANRFNSAFVVNATIAMPAAGSDITAAVPTITDASSGAGGVATNPNAGTGLSVALAATTPASTSIIIGQTAAKMASFTLTASNDGDVTVNTIKAKRGGISSDSTLSALYLYDGTTRLTENASVSSGYATWNNIGLKIAKGTTKTVTVVAKVAGTSGESVSMGIMSAADVTTDGATVSGSFPMVGNSMSVATATLAAVAFNATSTPTTGTVDAGQTGFTVWKNQVAVTTRTVNLESIRMRQIGSIATTDLKNFMFYVDGVQKGTTQQLSSDGYLQFDFATPVALLSGTRSFEVRADVVNGSSKTFSLSVRYDADVVVKDSEYGVAIAATNIPATSGTQTINAGTLSITKAVNSPAGDVVKDSSNATLAKFDVKAYGEPIKIEYMKIYASSSNTSVTNLRNGALYVNNVQVGSTANINNLTDAETTNESTTYSLGSSLTVYPGSPVVVEVRADIYDTASSTVFAANNTIQIVMDVYTNAAQRTVSLGYVDAPSVAVSGNAVTVKTGSVTAAKYSAYGSRTVVVPQTNYKIASFVVTGNSSEDVNLSSIDLSWTASGTFTEADLTDVYVVYNGVSTTIKSTVPASATSTWSIAKTLAKNANATIDVYANIGTSVTSGDAITTNLAVSGLTAQSSTSASSATVGQTITVNVGSIASSLDSASPNATLVKGGATVDVASFKFTTANDSYSITDATFTVGATGTTAVQSVILKDANGNALGSTYLNSGTAAFSGMAIPVSANGSTKLTVALQLGSIGTGAGTSGANVAVSMTGFKANNSAGVQTTDTTTVAGNGVYVYKAIPTIAVQALPTTILAAGTQTLAKFSITGDGEISWKKIAFTVTFGNSASASAYKLYDASNNTEIAGTFTGTSFVATNEQAVTGTKTYVLKATAGGTISAGSYISTSIAQPSTGTTAGDYDTVATTSASFVWSDVSANGHATSTADWTNDYLVKNLPTDSQTLTFAN